MGCHIPGASLYGTGGRVGGRTWLSVAMKAGARYMQGGQLNMISMRAEKIVWYPSAPRTEPGTKQASLSYLLNE